MKKHKNKFLETGTIYKQAPVKVALFYPNTYEIAASSLGFQTVYAIFNSSPLIQCERFVIDYEKGRRSIESGLPLEEFKFVLVSMSYENDIFNLFSFFLNNGINPLAQNRNDDQIFILGGAVTLSNPFVYLPFFDWIFLGEIEDFKERIIEVITASHSEKRYIIEDLLTINNSISPYQSSSDIENIFRAYKNLTIHPNFVKKLETPAHSSFTSPKAFFKDMFMIEISRGCPRQCGFCIINRRLSKFRFIDKEVIKRVDVSGFKKIGLVGAAVSDHPQLLDILNFFIKHEKKITLSSLRADRLNENLLKILKESGLKTVTTAVDGMSERLRIKIKKGVYERHIFNVAHLVKKLHFIGLRFYQIAGLPSETEDDLEEWKSVFDRVNHIVPARCNISIFVPKLRTHLLPDFFRSYKELKKFANHIKKKFSKVGEVKVDSPKEVFIHTLLSLGSPETGLKLLTLYQRGLPVTKIIKEFESELRSLNL